jgi:hypothetical protein
MDSYTDRIRKCLRNCNVTVNGSAVLNKSDMAEIYKLLEMIDIQTKAKKDYFRRYYQKNKQKILSKAHERYQEQKGAEVG